MLRHICWSRSIGGLGARASALCMHSFSALKSWATSSSSRVCSGAVDRGALGGCARTRCSRGHRRMALTLATVAVAGVLRHSIKYKYIPGRGKSGWGCNIEKQSSTHDHQPEINRLQMCECVSVCVTQTLDGIRARMCERT